MCKELKSKFAVRVFTQWSVSSPGSCELKPQAAPGLALKTRTAEEQSEKRVECVCFVSVLFGEA